MTTQSFYTKFDRYIPNIQKQARAMASDFETARFLYHETAHQAIKNKNLLKEDNLESWLVTTMNKIYRKIASKQIKLSN